MAVFQMQVYSYKDLMAIFQKQVSAIKSYIDFYYQAFESRFQLPRSNSHNLEIPAGFCYQNLMAIFKKQLPATKAQWPLFFQEYVSNIKALWSCFRNTNRFLLTRPNGQIFFRSGSQISRLMTRLYSEMGFGYHGLMAIL